MAKADFRFFHQLRVRWAECDMQAIVFNGNYLTYFDVAIMEYWRAIGLTYPQDLIDKHGCDSLAVKSTVEYHGSARFDELIDVGVRCAKIGNSSSQFLLEIYRHDEHLISGELLYVNVDHATRKSARLPESLRQKFRSFEGTRLDEGLTPHAG
jgi:acyl-CoA thioester hydrolase